MLLFVTFGLGLCDLSVTFTSLMLAESSRRTLTCLYINLFIYKPNLNISTLVLLLSHFFPLENEFVEDTIT